MPDVELPSAVVEHGHRKQFDGSVLGGGGADQKLLAELAVRGRPASDRHIGPDVCGCFRRHSENPEVRILFADRTSGPGEHLDRAAREEASDVLLQGTAHVIARREVRHRLSVCASTGSRPLIGM